MTERHPIYENRFARAALIFGCIGLKREREQSPVPSRRYIAFSAAGIISGAITLLTVLIRIVSELGGAGA